MAVPLIRGFVEKPVALPLQSVMEDKGSKLYGEDLKTFFSAYKVPIGIEVEVEGFAPEKWPAKVVYWKIKDDGSLKDRGAEVVSVPVAGRNIDYALRELEVAMAPQIPRWSHRCSVHVHINLRNWPITMVRALIAAYAACENLFFSLVPEDRRAGGFAYPVTDCNPGDVRLGHREAKYCAINIGSAVSEFGTVEFRHMYGTADNRTLRRWIQLIVKLHSYVRKTGHDKVIQAIERLNTTSEYHIFLNQVFGQTAAVFPPTVLQQAMEDGVLWAKVYLKHGGDI